MPKRISGQHGRYTALFSTRMFKVTSMCALVLLCAAVALPLWRLFPDLYAQPVVPLHYNIHYGVDWTGRWWQIFTFPVLGLCAIFINIALALFFIQRDRLLTNIILVSNVLLAALFFAAEVFAVSLNLVYG